MSDSLLTSKEINSIFKIWQKNNPNPTTELVYGNGFQLLVAVILSAQATDIGVNKATKKLFAVIQTPEELFELGEKKLIPYVKSIGLYKSKARNLILMAEKLMANFASVVPDNEKDLLSLAGVGIKTAGVILNTLYGKPTIAVDTHVFRVCNRLGIAQAKSPESLSAILPKSIPAKYRLNAHHWLILHGRYVCIARKPKCSECQLTKYCKYYYSQKSTTIDLNLVSG